MIKILYIVIQNICFLKFVISCLLLYLESYIYKQSLITFNNNLVSTKSYQSFFNKDDSRISFFKISNINISWLLINIINFVIFHTILLKNIQIIFIILSIIIIFKFLLCKKYECIYINIFKNSVN